MFDFETRFKYYIARSAGQEHTHDLYLDLKGAGGPAWVRERRDATTWEVEDDAGTASEKYGGLVRRISVRVAL